MKKIVNPYLTGSNSSEYKCFGCSPNNEIGLHLHFFDNGDDVVAIWEPQKQFEGYFNVLHGGIQATILDEIAAWVVNTKCKTAGVTSSMNVKYRNPIFMDGGPLTIKGKIESVNRRIATIKAYIENREGKVMAEADIVYFLFNEQDAKARYNYPGVEAFYEKE